MAGLAESYRKAQQDKREDERMFGFLHRVRKGFYDAFRKGECEGAYEGLRIVYETRDDFKECVDTMAFMAETTPADVLVAVAVARVERERK